MSRLDELTIRSLGVIEEARLPLGAGFTAITGETGAGKTMVVQALALLRGARADAGVIRSGEERAAVQGVWLVDDDEIAELVEDAGGAIDDGELILGRALTREGRSRAQAGGAAVPAGLLQQLADRLVAVHGQADQQRLRSAEAQAAALDRAAGAELGPVLDAYRTEFAAWREAQAAADAIRTARDARLAEAERLRTELEELEALAPEPGEQEALAALAHRLEHGESLRLQLAEAHAALSGDAAAVQDSPDAVGLAGHARRLVERAAADDASLAAPLDLLVQADGLLQEAAAAIAGALTDLEAPERPLDEVQERRAALAALERRLGVPLDEALEAAPQHALRLAELDDDDTRVRELEMHADERLDAATRLADRLSALRAAAATSLEDAVRAELAALAMPNARLVIEVASGDDLGPDGRDRVTMLLAPHPGAEPRPITKGASGGELSRIMLAIEVALAADDVPTMVFDEVDAGVGGQAAIEIGRRLAALAQHTQVIVVTHLAQVAAFADHHIRVEKATDGQVTASQVGLVAGDERLAELARMLSGTVSDTALAHADELLRSAKSVG